jgi:hypothetical protein
MELLQARCRTDRKVPEGRTEAQPNHSAYLHRQRIWRGVPCDPVVPCGGDDVTPLVVPEPATEGATELLTCGVRSAPEG